MESVSESRLNSGDDASFGAVVIGGSAGGIIAVMKLVAALPAEFPLPVVVVLHQTSGEKLYWPEHLKRVSLLPVVEAEDKMRLRPGTVYCGPAGYHLLVEREGTLALSVDEKVNYVRPSIDLLFSSAAEAFGARLIGIILTGANHDGAAGLADVAGQGGVAIVQSPQTAEWPEMPLSARTAVPGAMVVDLKDMATTLVRVAAGMQEGRD